MLARSTCNCVPHSLGYQSSTRSLTEDGLEMTTGTNQFGTFMLTLLLLPVLKASQPARVVVVSSDGHRFAKLFFDDYKLERNYTAMNAYYFSKLMNCSFAVELNRRLREEGVDVTVNSVHPGIVFTTNIQRSCAGKSAAYGLWCFSMSVCDIWMIWIGL